MGILKTFLEEKKVAKRQEVCIPDHAKPKNTVVNDETTTFPASFVVEGTYEIKREITVTGKVLLGTLKSDSKLVYKGLLIPIKEIISSGKSIDELKKGEKGAFTIQPDTLVMIKASQTLKFQ